MPNRIPYFKPHRPAAMRDTSRAERSAFYSSARWMRLRAAFLFDHPLCVACEAQGRLTPATIAHHVVERLARPDLALSESNLSPYCHSCHSKFHMRGKTP